MVKPESTIEVFKTNVRNKSQAKKIVGLLARHFPGSKINFDLHDCDKILRMEGRELVVEKVIKLVKENGCACDLLE